MQTKIYLFLELSLFPIMSLNFGRARAQVSSYAFILRNLNIMISLSSGTSYEIVIFQDGKLLLQILVSRQAYEMWDITRHVHSQYAHLKSLLLGLGYILGPCNSFCVYDTKLTYSEIELITLNSLVTLF
jgi:hypothetical protein